MAAADTISAPWTPASSGPPPDANGSGSDTKNLDVGEISDVRRPSSPIKDGRSACYVSMRVSYFFLFFYFFFIFNSINSSGRPGKRVDGEGGRDELFSDSAVHPSASSEKRNPLNFSAVRKTVFLAARSAWHAVLSRAEI